MKLIEKRYKDNVGTIILNNPAQKNAISEELAEDFITTLESFDKEKTLTIVIRAHKGVKVWSAGHNIKELPMSKDPLEYTVPLRRLIRSIQDFPCPIISMIEGSVWGGAFELIRSTDIIIASNDSTFAITPTKLGVPYDTVGVINLMSNISIPLIKEMLFTAAPISAERAEKAGIINHAVQIDELENFTYSIIDKIKKNAPLAISLIKEEIKILSSSIAVNPKDYEKIHSMRATVYHSKDYKEGIDAFLEKRKPIFKGQ